MPERGDVDKLLAEQKAVEDRRKQLIDEIMKAKAAAVKEFDEQLDKLGYHPDGRKKRSHHKTGAKAPAEAKAKA